MAPCRPKCRTGHGEAARSAPERHRRSRARRRARPRRSGAPCRAGGATLVQLRDKKSDTRAMVEVARAIKAALVPLPSRLSSTIGSMWRSPRGPTACISGPTTWRPKTRGRCSGRMRSSACRSRASRRPKRRRSASSTMPASAASMRPLSKEQKAPPIGPEGFAAHRRSVAPPRAGAADCRHRRYRCRQCRRGHRRRRRRRCGHFGALARGRSRSRGARLRRSSTACWRSGARDDRRSRSPLPARIRAAAPASKADLKTFSALGVYGACVSPRSPRRTPRACSRIHDVPADFIAAQIDAVFADLDIGAVKIGMLANAPAIDAVAAGARSLSRPQCRARSGHDRELGRALAARGCARRGCAA